MKKYKFVGDSTGWGWKINPVKGFTYEESQLGKMYGQNWEDVGGIKLIENWDFECYGDTGIWEEVVDKPSIVDKLVKLDGIFDELLSCTEVIWEEIKHGDPDISKEDQKKVLELIHSITFKYDRLREDFN